MKSRICHCVRAKYTSKAADLTGFKLKEVQRLLLEHMNGNDNVSSKRRNVNPKAWGGPGWKFLDTVVDGYPMRARHGDQVQMLDLGGWLGCQMCLQS